jgi:hypothetical protein
VQPLIAGSRDKRRKPFKEQGPAAEFGKLLNLNVSLPASQLERISMKKFLTICLCSAALGICLFAQSPSVSPATSPAAPAPSTSPTGDLADKIQQRLDREFKKHRGITIGDHEPNADDQRDRDLRNMGEEMAIPIVAIVFTTLLGAPVLIVAVIMIINYAKARSLHRTVRAMVEKGQPVPTALLAPPAAPRARSDLRRGVVLAMIGIGLIIFLGVDDGWSDGSWSVGVIPLLIGCGYLIVWKLEKTKDNGQPVS